MNGKGIFFSLTVSGCATIITMYWFFMFVIF